LDLTIKNGRVIDGTGMKVNGEKWWLWIFRTDKADVLAIIRKSRGKNVLHEILEEEYKGVVVADGWRAYNGFALQRCWAHLIREVDDFKEQSEEGGGYQQRFT
jgi:IS1 family transposase